jgi:hypothetical protein
LIAHIVLFRLRPDVSLEDRRALLDAWATALNDIPVIRRARVGRRVHIGRSYESLTRLDFPYVAVLEFDNVETLRAYLDHPHTRRSPQDCLRQSRTRLFTTSK